MRTSSSRRRPRASARPELPPAIDDVLAQAMAKKPDDRYATAKELSAAVREALTEPVADSAPAARRITANASGCRTPGRRAPRTVLRRTADSGEPPPLRTPDLGSGAGRGPAPASVGRPRSPTASGSGSRRPSWHSARGRPRGGAALRSAAQSDVLPSAPPSDDGGALTGATTAANDRPRRPR